MQRLIAAALVISCFAMAGCVHIPLARNTGRQVQTIASIQEQQVLDNIAMFAANPGATPFFAVPTGGATQVRQGGSAGVGLTWNPTTLVSEVLNLNSTADLSENWSLQPINNPDRLKLMKCVYRQVTRQASGDPCLDCSEKLNQFFDDDFLLCEAPTCWFGCGTKKEIPSCCKKVGHYCGVYVWVEPSHFDQLSRVTLAILDIATVDISGIGAPTIAIEETFEFGGKKIKGKYSVDKEKYEEWRDSLQGTSYTEDGRAIPALPELEVGTPSFRSRIEGRTDVESLLLLPRGE